MIHLKLLGFFFLISISFTQSARILGIYPLPGHSHYHLAKALFRGLAERGHDVTVISAFGEKEPTQNGTYRDIVLELFVLEVSSDQSNNKDWDMFKRVGLNPFLGAYIVATMATKGVEMTLKDENVQKLLHSDETFDVVITDNFLTDAYKAFATHFDAPLIAVSPVGPNFWINPLVGNPSPPSYVPNVLYSYYPPMSFCDRLVNSLLDGFNYLLYYYYVYPKQNEMVQKYIPRGGNLFDVLYNTSLVLLNSHPSLNMPVPSVPNMVHVGGFHMPPPKTLPQDLQDFLDNAKDGVIYFSMGSNLQAVNWPEEKRQTFINVFSKLKQKVLWKWEDDELPGKPGNVKISKWVPQPDVLAHPNIKLFITHGGFVSSSETAYNGIPVLVIPIYGDQAMNAHFAKTNGFGRILTLPEITEDTLLENINEILNNPQYKENAMKRSKIFHDRLVNPLDEALYWVEYVIRHRGAPHLRVAGLDLPWYQYFLLDVVAVLVLGGSCLLLVSCFITRKIFKKICTKKESSQKKRRKKQKTH